jgi:hypothetical protein
MTLPVGHRAYVHSNIPDCRCAKCNPEAAATLAAELPPFDRTRIGGLARDIMLPVRDNFLRGPASRDRVYEALNALACVAGAVLAGCGEEGARHEAWEWFQLALEQQLADLPIPATRRG